jgi:hypothetical protein
MMALSPLRQFFLAALLWLPFAFFLWFAFASQLAWPVIQLAKLAMLHIWPAFFTAVSQGADVLEAGTGRLLGHSTYLMQFSSGEAINVSAPGLPPKFGFPDYQINPMVYGYSLPLFCGLVTATPLEKGRWLLQLVIGMLLLWCAQAFGVVAEAFEIIAFKSGQEGLAAMRQAGISLNSIALAYQFGYLILPPLAPVILWILFNRRFIEELTGVFGAPVSRQAIAEPNPKPAVEPRQSLKSEDTD